MASSTSTRSHRHVKGSPSDTEWVYRFSLGLIFATTSRSTRKLSSAPGPEFSRATSHCAPSLAQVIRVPAQTVVHPQTDLHAGRVISVLRDPLAVLRSYFSFYQAKGHPLVQGKTIDEWGAEWCVSGTWPGHILWDYYVQLWKCWEPVRSAMQAASTDGVEAVRQVSAEAPILVLEFERLARGLDEHAPRFSTMCQSTSF